MARPKSTVSTRQNRQKKWLLGRPTRPKYGFFPDRTDQNVDIKHREETETWVLARLNRSKYGYCPNRTDQNMGSAHAEQTKTQVKSTPKYGF